MSRTRLLCLLAAAMLLLAAPPALAQGSPPTRGDILAARATPARRVALTNGMTVLLKESPANDFVAIEMLCQVGLQNEDSPTAGLIALWEKLLQDRLDEALAENYRVVSKTVSIEPDFLRFSVVGPSKDARDVIKALASIVNNSTYEEAEVSKKRKILKDEIESGGGENNQLYSIFRVLFYRFHPYRRQHTGGVLALDRINAAVISDFHKKYLVPNRLVMAVVGRYRRIETEDVLRSTFGPMKSNVVTDLSVPWEPKAAEKRIDLNTRADLGWVLVGYPAPTAASEDHIPMMLIQAVLSEGLSSRLFNEIREKKGLSYTISSVHPDLKGPGHFLTYVVTRPADVGKVRREVLKQVEILKKELLPADELAAAKEKLRGAFLLESETVQGTAFRLARAESIGLGYSYEENFEKNLKKVTAQEIRRVAVTYLVNPTIIIARPAGRFYFDG
jgi:predicted Zn-dependent peptidase